MSERKDVTEPKQKKYCSIINKISNYTSSN